MVKESAKGIFNHFVFRYVEAIIDQLVNAFEVGCGYSCFLGACIFQNIILPCQIIRKQIICYFIRLYLRFGIAGVLVFAVEAFFSVNWNIIWVGPAKALIGVWVQVRGERVAFLGCFLPFWRFMDCVFRICPNLSCLYYGAISGVSLVQDVLFCKWVASGQVVACSCLGYYWLG